jgi:hypothetical protein
MLKTGVKSFGIVSLKNNFSDDKLSSNFYLKIGKLHKSLITKYIQIVLFEG